MRKGSPDVAILLTNTGEATMACNGARCQSQARKSPPRRQAAGLLSLFERLRRPRDMDRLMALKSFSDTGHHKVPFPSPLTPAYVRMGGAHEREVSDQEDVEDACRSFENYLVEMIVDEGKVRDLMDVEELLRCWKNLKCPVFTDLVCRFYGELCKDLFTTNGGDDMDTRSDYTQE
ncbi:hypothetical protein U1Q18_033609 [Sarracenia purpurea var. burkii]